MHTSEARYDHSNSRCDTRMKDGDGDRVSEEKLNFEEHSYSADDLAVNRALMVVEGKNTTRQHFSKERMDRHQHQHHQIESKQRHQQQLPETIEKQQLQQQQQKEGRQSRRREKGNTSSVSRKYKFSPHRAFSQLRKTTKIHQGYHHYHQQHQQQQQMGRLAEGINQLASTLRDIKQMTIENERRRDGMLLNFLAQEGKRNRAHDLLMVEAYRRAGVDRALHNGGGTGVSVDVASEGGRLCKNEDGAAEKERAEGTDVDREAVGWQMGLSVDGAVEKDQGSDVSVDGVLNSDTHLGGESPLLNNVAVPPDLTIDKLYPAPNDDGDTCIRE